MNRMVGIFATPLPHSSLQNGTQQPMPPVTIRIAPSILAADFARLGEQVAEAERCGADRIHVDVMDGHFVPNISLGPVIVKWLRPLCPIPLEIHLMISEPDRYL